MTAHYFMTFIFIFTVFPILYLTHLSEKYVRNLSNLKDVTKAKCLTWTSISGIIIIIIWVLYKIKWPPVLISISFVIDALFLAALTHQLWVLLKVQYLLIKSPCDLIGNHYIIEHIKYYDKNDMFSAEESIVNACAFNPQNPKAWLLRANFTAYNKNQQEEANKYLETARQLIEKCPNPDKETLAVYEFYKGSLLIREDRLMEALVHLKKSQKLSFLKSRADYIKKVEDHINNS